jgi:hypothetical protein
MIGLIIRQACSCHDVAFVSSEYVSLLFLRTWISNKLVGSYLEAYGIS